MEDIILRDFLLSSASVYTCRGGVNGDSPTELTVRDLSAVASALDTANAFKFLSGKQGEDRLTLRGDVKSWVIDLELPLAA